MPRTRNPAPFTKRSPPVEKRTALAIFLAMSTSGGIQEDVVGDQKLARSHHGCAGGGMHARLAEVGLARGIGGDLVANAFELAAADVFQILALGRGGGGFVEIDRDPEALRNFGAHVARHGDAVLDA